MQNRRLEQLRQEERNRIWKERGDRFWGAFLFTKDGKVKVRCCCILLPLYGVCGGLRRSLCEFDQPPSSDAGRGLHGMDQLRGGGCTHPGGDGGMLLCLASPGKADDAVCLSVAGGPGCCVPCGHADYPGRRLPGADAVLQFFGLFVPAPILLGGGLSLWLYRRYQRRRPAQTNGRIERTVRQ